jgi:hypothetical protein
MLTGGALPSLNSPFHHHVLRVGATTAPAPRFVTPCGCSCGRAAGLEPYPPASTSRRNSGRCACGCAAALWSIAAPSPDPSAVSGAFVVVVVVASTSERVSSNRISDTKERFATPSAGSLGRGDHRPICSAAVGWSATARPLSRDVGRSVRNAAARGSEVSFCCVLQTSRQAQRGCEAPAACCQPHASCQNRSSATCK